MNPLRQARLALAMLALSSLGLSTAAKADPILGRVVGSVIGIVVGKALVHGSAKTANCRLYDRNGAEVYLPCDANRPVGELLTAERPVAATPQALAPPYDLAQLDAAAYGPPPQDDCGCRYGSGASAQPTYGRAEAGYDADSQSRDALRYTDSAYSAGYGDSYRTAYGQQSQYGYAQESYSYGSAGYGADAYAYYGYGHAAGRDPNGFLTWPGKRPR